jgi:hypothetical protein
MDNMLLPKGGVNWKAARARIPPARQAWYLLTRTRFLLFVALSGIAVLLWRGLSGTAGEMQKYDFHVLRVLYTVDADIIACL